MGDTLIKTTARFQEAQEPVKHRPIIQIDKTALPNTIRASIESGRDNPFRPDGEIYKSADPIVDYYKYGPNQSRTHSPTDSQLLLNGSQAGEADKKGKKRRKKDEASATGDGTPRKPCWRRWLCCCCCCWNSKCCRKKTNEADQAGQTTNTKQTDVLQDREETLAPVPVRIGTGVKERQTKIVVLRDADNSIINAPPPSGTKNSRIEFISGSGFTTSNNNNEYSTIEGEENRPQQSTMKQTETKAKKQEKSSEGKSTSRCIVS